MQSGGFLFAKTAKSPLKADYTDYGGIYYDKRRVYRV